MVRAAAPPAAASTQKTDTGPQRRLGSNWTPESVIKTLAALTGLVVSLFAAISWTAVRYDRIVSKTEEVERRVAKNEERYSRIAEDGILPAAVEQRLRIMQRDISEIKAAVTGKQSPSYSLGSTSTK